MISTGQKRSLGEHMVASGPIRHLPKTALVLGTDMKIVTRLRISIDRRARRFARPRWCLHCAPGLIWNSGIIIDSGKCGLSKYLWAGRGKENKPRGIKCGVFLNHRYLDLKTQFCFCYPNFYQVTDRKQSNTLKLQNTGFTHVGPIFSPLTNNLLNW